MMKLAFQNTYLQRLVILENFLYSRSSIIVFLSDLKHITQCASEKYNSQTYDTWVQHSGFRVKGVYCRVDTQLSNTT